MEIYTATRAPLYKTKRTLQVACALTLQRRMFIARRLHPCELVSLSDKLVHFVIDPRAQGLAFAGYLGGRMLFFLTSLAGSAMKSSKKSSSGMTQARRASLSDWASAENNCHSGLVSINFKTLSACDVLSTNRVFALSAEAQTFTVFLCSGSFEGLGMGLFALSASGSAPLLPLPTAHLPANRGKPNGGGTTRAKSSGIEGNRKSTQTNRAKSSGIERTQAKSSEIENLQPRGVCLRPKNENFFSHPH